MKPSLLFAVSLLTTSSGAQALTIDFGSAGTPTICAFDIAGTGALSNCGNGSYINQSFADVAGLADITYSSIPRVASSTPTSLRWWGGSYNNLYGVAFANISDADSRARIEIRALDPNQSVTLNSFALGAYFNTTRNTNVDIYAIGGGTALYSFAGGVGNGSVSATTFTPNLTVAGGLWLEFKDSAYNVGIDNINYSVSAVPEPMSALMMLAGVGALVARQRLARKAV
jgi:hypothetical protein